jgi:hypothetical protein
LSIVLLVAVRYGAHAWSKRLYLVLVEKWSDHYAGSQWRTPAGEVGDFIRSDQFGSVVAIRFAKNDEDYWSVGNLTPVDGRDMTSVNPKNGTLPFILTGATVLALFTPVFGVATLEEFGSYSINSVALSVWWGCFVGAMNYGFNKSGNYEDSNNALLRRVSVCEWKTLDGRVGKVRWAYRQSGDNEYNTDYLRLVFPDGTKARFERPDLRPVEQVEAA